MKNDDFKLSADQIILFLKELKDKELVKHYSAVEDASLGFEDTDALVKYIKETHPIKISIKNNLIYYNFGDENINEEIFDVDVSKSFAQSDKWLFDKITKPVGIFPNVSSCELSSEMSSLYVCIIIASALGDVFEEELISTVESYDFKGWKPTGKALTFSKLSSEWVQMGSKTIKMMASAAKYALVREKEKKPFPLTLELPKDMVGQFRTLRQEIANIRYRFDNEVLSEEKRKDLTKLEIKNLYASMESEIQTLVEKDKILHKVYRLSKLNSNSISPIDLRGFSLSSRKYSLILFKDLYDREVKEKSDDDKFILKKIQDKLKKEAIRAAINKKLAEEIILFNEDRENYCPPSFV